MQMKHLVVIAIVTLGFAHTAFAGNLNTAFYSNEVPDGSETVSFAGPYGGTIALGYALNPSNVGDFTTASMVHTNAFNGVADLEGWYISNNIIVPAVLINTNAGAITTNFGVPSIASQQMLLHPGNPGADGYASPASAAILRYTVGTSGTYNITGSFDEIGAGGQVAVDVLLNGTSILSAGAGTDATPFSELGVALTVGDFLDFVVDDANGIGSDSTGLVADVFLVPPPAPEPSTFALLGLAGLTLLRRRN